MTDYFKQPLNENHEDELFDSQVSHAEKVISKLLDESRYNDVEEFINFILKKDNTIYSLSQAASVANYLLNNNSNLKQEGKYIVVKNWNTTPGYESFNQIKNI